MSRKISDIKERSMPSVGRHKSIITKAKKETSPNKKTPYIELTMNNGEVEFTDSLFVTGKALGRLSMVAKRVCNIDENTEIPDDDNKAAEFLANFILLNAVDKKCVVTIQEFDRSYMPENGPNMGRKMTVKEKKVAFDGYGKYEETEEFIEPTKEEIKEATRMSDDDFFTQDNKKRPSPF